MTPSTQWTSSASKQKLIDALVARAAWRHANHQPPEWENTITRITPVKKASAPGRCRNLRLTSPTLQEALLPSSIFIATCFV